MWKPTEQQTDAWIGRVTNARLIGVMRAPKAKIVFSDEDGTLKKSIKDLLDGSAGPWAVRFEWPDGCMEHVSTVPTVEEAQSVVRFAAGLLHVLAEREGVKILSPISVQ